MNEELVARVAKIMRDADIDYSVAQAHKNHPHEPEQVKFHEDLVRAGEGEWLFPMEDYIRRARILADAGILVDPQPVDDEVDPCYENHAGVCFNPSHDHKRS